MHYNFAWNQPEGYIFDLHSLIFVSKMNERTFFVNFTCTNDLKIICILYLPHKTATSSFKFSQILNNDWFNKYQGMSQLNWLWK